MERGWLRAGRTAFFILLTLTGAGAAPAQNATFPGAAWPAVDTSGWDPVKLAAAERYVESLKPLGVMVVHNGQAITRLGSTTTKTNLHSVRKSLLSALFGTAVEAKKINLDSTLGALGIDDRPPSLTTVEKAATVRQLLQARSGVYHDAAYETASMKAARPARGSHAPGTFWYYNNWDFNAAGSIYVQLTGESIARGFADRIARPIGMEDFQESDVRLTTEPGSSHPAYPFKMATQDLARFGLLFLNQGVWKGKQVIPAGWVAESTKAWTPDADGSAGYGYMWWTLPERVGSRSDVGSQFIGPGAYAAAGVGGQRLCVIPHHGLVIAVTVDTKANRDGISRSEHYTFTALLVAAKKG